MDQVKIGKFIARLRREKNMTQKELADRLGVTDRAVGNWENGRRMPDYSIVRSLCAELGITINDLLAGERVETEKKEEQFEKNILGIMTISMTQKRKRQLISGIMGILLVFSLCFCVWYVLVRGGIIMDPELKYVQRYSPQTWYINYETMEQYSADFEMGVNKYHDTVFRNPDKAFKRLVKDYSLGLEAIRREYDLKPINKHNWRAYGTYGWQLEDASEEEIEQGRFISKFFDVYENSYQLWWRYTVSFN